jgi:hypothetical protein
MKMLTLLLFFAGCKKEAIVAPAELEELCPYLFRNHDDPEALAVGLASLQTWLDGRGAVADDAGYILQPLTEEDVAAVEHPDRDLADALGGAADAISAASLDQHTAFILLPDQSVVNPDDYPKFDRTFVEGGDCFADGGCDLLRTTNDMIKSKFNIDIPYQYPKDYRRIFFATETEEARVGVVSRGWVAEESLSEGGANGILQSFTLDVFLGQPDGTVHRVQALWTEAKLSFDPGDTYMQEEIVRGLHDVFDDTDEAIVEQGL